MSNVEKHCSENMEKMSDEHKVNEFNPEVKFQDFAVPIGQSTVGEDTILLTNMLQYPTQQFFRDIYRGFPFAQKCEIRRYRRQMTFKERFDPRHSWSWFEWLQRVFSPDDCVIEEIETVIESIKGGN